MDYSCGSVFTNIDTDNDALAQVFVRKNLTCGEPIEIPYYGVGHDLICFHCGTVDGLFDVLPACVETKVTILWTTGKHCFVDFQLCIEYSQ